MSHAPSKTSQKAEEKLRVDTTEARWVAVNEQPVTWVFSQKTFTTPLCGWNVKFPVVNYTQAEWKTVSCFSICLFFPLSIKTVRQERDWTEMHCFALWSVSQSLVPVLLAGDFSVGSEPHQSAPGSSSHLLRSLPLHVSHVSPLLCYSTAALTRLPRLPRHSVTITFAQLGSASGSPSRAHFIRITPGVSAVAPINTHCSRQQTSALTLMPCVLANPE